MLPCVASFSPGLEEKHYAEFELLLTPIYFIKKLRSKIQMVHSAETKFIIV